MPKNVAYDHAKYRIWIVKDWETFQQFLEAEATIKILKCFANWCGFCHKFQPIYEASAPPTNDSAPSSHWPLFAAFDSDVCLKLMNELWFPEAIKLGLAPPGTKYMEGGKPNFMIFSGTEHSFASKNQILGSYVGYCEQPRFLALLEYYVSGILQTDTFGYLDGSILNKARDELKSVQAMKAAEAMRSKAGGDGKQAVPTGAAPQSGGETPCTNPDCPKHGKKQAAGSAPSQPHGGTTAGHDGKTDCKNPNCPVHGKSGGHANPTQPQPPQHQWNRKLLFKQKTNRPFVFQETTLIPAVHSVRSAGKTYFSTFHEDTGSQTFWEARYPPSNTGPELKNVNQSVIDIAMDMNKKHQVPWKIIPDQSVQTVTLKLLTKNASTRQSAGGTEGKQTVEYQPQVFEGVQAYNWISNYHKSLDALSKQYEQTTKTGKSKATLLNKTSTSNTKKRTVNLWE